MATVALAMSGPQFQSRSIPETVYRVYEAKRAAEQTRLVGKQTDMVLIRRGSESQYLSDELIEELRSIYKRRKPSPLADGELSAIEGVLPKVTPPPAPKAPRELPEIVRQSPLGPGISEFLPFRPQFPAPNVPGNSRDRNRSA